MGPVALGELYVTDIFNKSQKRQTCRYGSMYDTDSSSRNRNVLSNAICKNSDDFYD
jgi:hypothetical protein